MPVPRLILCEKSPRWATAFRLALSGDPPQVIETRSLASCETELAASPDSLILMEVTEANRFGVLELMDRTSRRHPQARVLIALSEETAALEPLFREAGAIAVLFRTLEVASAARLARRHFQLAPSGPLGPREFAFQRMPWSAYAVATR